MTRTLIFLIVAGVGLGCDSSPPAASSSETATESEPSAEERRAALLEVMALEDPAGSTAIDQTLRQRQKASKATPERADLWVLVGRSWVQKARNDFDTSLYDHADAAAQRALLIDPEHAPALNLRALAMLDAHRFADARSHAERVLKLDPDNPMALGTVSDAALELGDYESAADAAQKMLDRKPNLPSYARAGHLKWLTGHPDAALELMRQAFDAGRGQTDPEPGAWALCEAADIFRREGDYEGAIAGYDMALERFDGYPPALAGKARALLARGDAEDAARLASRALKSKPTVHHAWLLGDAHRLAGHVEAAEKAYRRAEELGEQDPLALALFLATRERDVERAVELAKAEVEARSNIWTEDAYGWALHRAGRHEEARKWAERATRLGTPDPVLRYHAAAIAHANGDPEALTTIQGLLDSHGEFEPTLAAEARELISKE